MRQRHSWSKARNVRPRGSPRFAAHHFDGTAARVPVQATASGCVSHTRWSRCCRPGGTATRPIAVLQGRGSGILAVALSEAADLVASASFDGNVRRWDTRSDEQISLLEGHTSGVRCVALSRDGPLLEAPVWTVLCDCGSYRPARCGPFCAGILAASGVSASALTAHRSSVQVLTEPCSCGMRSMALVS
jgi:WD40 repeat protein